MISILFWECWCWFHGPDEASLVRVPWALERNAFEVADREFNWRQ